MFMCRTKELAGEDVSKTVAPWESADYSGKEEGNAYLDKTDTAKYSRSGTIGDRSAYEPLQVDQVGHHSYSKCTFGQATEGGQDGEYAPLDVTETKDTQFAVPVARETLGEKNEYANSLALVDAAPKKAELHQAGWTATDDSSPAYANIGFAADEGSHKDATKVPWKQQFDKGKLKGMATQPPPTMAKPKKTKDDSASKPADTTEDNVVVGLGSHVAPLVAIEVGQQETQVPPQLVAKPILQDGKKKESSKVAADEKHKKKPLLPKHLTAAVTLPSNSKGKTPASTPHPPAIKEATAKDEESTSAGKVAELARKLEKGE